MERDGIGLCVLQLRGYLPDGGADFLVGVGRGHDAGALQRWLVDARGMTEHVASESIGLLIAVGAGNEGYPGVLAEGFEQLLFPRQQFTGEEVDDTADVGRDTLCGNNAGGSMEEVGGVVVVRGARTEAPVGIHDGRAARGAPGKGIEPGIVDGAEVFEGALERLDRRGVFCDGREYAGGFDQRRTDGLATQRRAKGATLAGVAGGDELGEAAGNHETHIEQATVAAERAAGGQPAGIVRDNDRDRRERAITAYVIDRAAQCRNGGGTMVGNGRWQ